MVAVEGYESMERQMKKSKRRVAYGTGVVTEMRPTQTQCEGEVLCHNSTYLQ